MAVMLVGLMLWTSVSAADNITGWWDHQSDDRMWVGWDAADWSSLSSREHFKEGYYEVILKNHNDVELYNRNIGNHKNQDPYVHLRASTHNFVWCEGKTYELNVRAMEGVEDKKIIDDKGNDDPKDDETVPWLKPGGAVIAEGAYNVIFQQDDDNNAQDCGGDSENSDSPGGNQQNVEGREINASWDSTSDSDAAAWVIKWRKVGQGFQSGDIHEQAISDTDYTITGLEAGDYVVRIELKKNDGSTTKHKNSRYTAS